MSRLCGKWRKLKDLHKYIKLYIVNTYYINGANFSHNPTGHFSCMHSAHLRILL